jgi:hypothetical protein
MMEFSQALSDTFTSKSNSETRVRYALSTPPKNI